MSAIKIASIELNVRYSDISEHYMAEITFNGCLRVISDLQHKTPEGIYDMIVDAGICIDDHDVKLQFSFEKNRYSGIQNVLKVCKCADRWIIYTEINGSDFEYAMQPESYKEAFTSACCIIKPKK